MAGQPKKRAGKTRKAKAVLAERARMPEVPGTPPPPPPPPVDTRTAREKLDELGIDGFCDKYIDGQSLRHIAREMDISPSSILNWLEADAGRQERYQRAREECAEAMASEVIQIAEEPIPSNAFGSLDGAAVQDKRLRIDARKWVAQKLKPRVYGEKLDLTSGGNPLQNMTEQQIDARLQMLLAKAAVKSGGSDEQNGESDVRTAGSQGTGS